MGTVTLRLFTSLACEWQCSVTCRAAGRAEGRAVPSGPWSCPLPNIHQSVSIDCMFSMCGNTLGGPIAPGKEKVILSISGRVLISFHNLASSFPGTAHPSHWKEQFIPWELFIHYTFRFSAFCIQRAFLRRILCRPHLTNFIMTITDTNIFT